VVDWNISVWDLLEILEQEDRNYCLCWNSEKQRIEGIHLMVDFMNLLLNIDFKHLLDSKDHLLVYILDKTGRLAKTRARSTR
jgi:hypothetical protein